MNGLSFGVLCRKINFLLLNSASMFASIKRCDFYIFTDLLSGG